MKEEYFQMIDLYLERERIRHYHELELFNQEVLEDFFRYWERTKVEDFNLSYLTEEDKKDYYRYLLGDYPANTVIFARGKMRTVDNFLAFLTRVGLLSKNPWEGSGQLS